MNIAQRTESLRRCFEYWSYYLFVPREAFQGKVDLQYLDKQLKIFSQSKQLNVKQDALHRIATHTAEFHRFDTAAFEQGEATEAQINEFLGWIEKRYMPKK